MNFNVLFYVLKNSFYVADFRFKRVKYTENKLLVLF